MFTFVAFDVETTGTRAGKDKIIEIGAEKFVLGKPVESFQSFVRINIPIPDSATRVHGITSDMLVGQPAIEDALEAFTAFCGDAILLAHNAPFDIKFIGLEAEEAGVTLPDRVVLDSYPLAKRALPDLFNHRLENLIKHFQIKAEAHHRANDDARSCGLVFLQLLKILKEKECALDGRMLVEWSGGELRFPIVEARARQLDFL